ncbi:MAG TPA: DUF1289 domain-containing protein [Rhodanobacteraceae bacterium]|nr:DUF1289 domain-containing protein [Rhodanobacteraceae bacterium]
MPNTPMSFPPNNPIAPPAASSESPCVGICRLDANGYCVGCSRSLGEIAAWSQLDSSERKRIMTDVLPRRVWSHGRT